MTGAAVAAALGSATLFGTATALQHHQARRVAATASPGLLVTLAQRPLWLLALLAEVAAVAFQGWALSLGSVALVQTLLVAGLPLAAVLSAVLHRRPLRAFEVAGVLLCALGLAVLGPVLSSAPSTHVPRRSVAVLAGVIVTAVVLPLLASRHRPRLGPACAGTAAGVLIGTSAVLLAVTTTRLARGEAVFTTWAPYAALGVGLLSLLVAQMAFQTGDLGAPLAALSVVEPVVAVVLAVTVLHETVPISGGRVLALAAGGTLAVASVLVLSRRATP